MASGSVARRLFVPAVVGVMVVPALIVTVVLWRSFVIQIDESLHKRLTSSLSIMELVVTEGVEDFRAALARLAADNTLQVTVGLDIRPQMRRSLDKQFSLTQFSFIQMLGLDGTALASVGPSAKTELNCHGPADEITERVVAHDSELILVRAQPLAQNGAVLGRLCAGFSLNRGAVAAAITSKFDGEALMMSMRDLCVSSGSACTSANPEPSHVLRALGLSDDLTRASLRFGLGRFNTEAEVEFAVDLVDEAVGRLRRMNSLA